MEYPLIHDGGNAEMILDDGDLVDRFQHQPAYAPQAFRTLYHRYARPIFAYLYARVGNRMDAEDLTEQVFLEALERLQTYRHQGYFSAWLFTIARRRAVDHYRRDHRDLPLDQALLVKDHHDDLLDKVVHHETLLHLKSLIQDLDENELELLRLHFAGGLNFAAMAEILSRKESAVKMAYYRLLRRLENQLEVRHG